MSRVREHYETLLGKVYAWSVSVAGDPLTLAESWLERHGLLGRDSYLDLGAGFGAHAQALARFGKQVTAVDFDATLLEQLSKSLGKLAPRVKVHHGDLLAFLRGAGVATWDVVLCLGDTIAHLENTGEVEELIALCVRHLAARGLLALSYRDSTMLSAEGVGRFREVARDASRTMHCLLEPLDEGRLRVTDIVTDIEPDGPRTRISDYVKLRLAPARVAAWAASKGLTRVGEAEERGMVTQIFEAVR
ncbi:MAG: class I SAM-dependent methyltransferase [Deltaproteobacteria bacterium]|nr:class I SAM-dependent methyltransferase [Deltaproteobacteria bacterium]